MQSAHLNFKMYERLYLITQNDTPTKQKLHEQMSLFQKYGIDFKILTESYRSEIQKHILVYLTYCDKEEGKKVWAFKKIIDSSESIKDYKEYNSMTDYGKIVNKQESDQRASADEFEDSYTGKALLGIMNLLGKDVIEFYEEDEHQ
jgi:hypothetical protein